MITGLITSVVPSANPQVAFGSILVQKGPTSRAEECCDLDVIFNSLWVYRKTFEPSSDGAT